MNRKAMFAVAVAVLLVWAVTGVGAGGKAEGGKGKSVAVYMPGLLGGGNAMLDMSKAGAEKAAKETGITLKLIEGGYDWSAYEPSLEQLSASKQYDAIVCFTAGFPGIMEKVMPKYPEQKYILVDAVMNGGQQLYSAQFNSAEMAYLAGAFAGMVTKSSLPHANPAKKIGMTAGMIYPEMTDLLKPGYENGAHRIDAGIEVVFVVTNTWNDPVVGKEIGINMAKAGVDAIFMISNVTDQGTIEAAKENGAYCISVNTNMNSVAPGVVLTGVTKSYDKIVYEAIKSLATGSTPWGKQETYGIRDGMVGYTPDDPLYLQYVPKDIRDRMQEIYGLLKSGKIDPLKP
jgi:riboflavin transport system substrate-binding protein